MSDRERPKTDGVSRRPHVTTDLAARAAFVAAAFAVLVITSGFIVQAWRRGYGPPMYLLQADYIGSLSLCVMLSFAIMWPWRKRLGWFQVPMAPALTYTFLVLLAYVARSIPR
jgi:hypothetical protein